MKQLFFSLLTISLITTGCMKEEIRDKETNSESELVLKSNSTNPYEYIGVQHNLTLAYILNINSTDYSVAVGHIAQTLNEPQSRFASWSTIQSGINAAIADGYGEFDNATNDPDVGNYMSMLQSILLNSSSSTIESNTNTLVININNPNNGLSDENRAMLLATTAVAKHSFVFWVDSQGPSGLSNVWRDAVGFYQGFRLEWDNNLGLDGFASKVTDSVLSGLGGAAIASGS